MSDGLSGILQALKLDHWYKVAVLLGAVVLVWSLFNPVLGQLSSSQVQQIAVATLLVGFGEWLNHVEASGPTPASARYGGPYLVTMTVRRFSLIGTIFVLAGLWIGGRVLWPLVIHDHVIPSAVRPSPDSARIQ